MTDSAASTIRLGTRGSRLAMVQAEAAAAALRAAAPARPVELVSVATAGDRDSDRPVAELGGRGSFTSELERHLVAGEIDAAVHSAKDLPVAMDPAATIGAVLPRGDVRDALVSRDGIDLDALPTGSLVGTGSPRRRAQLRAVRPDLRFTDLRGNVETRLAKLDAGVCDAAVLAAAGLQRLGCLDARSRLIDVERMVPAPGQGIIAIQCRRDDAAMLELLGAVREESAAIELAAERLVMAGLGVGCHTPLGAVARRTGGEVSLLVWFQRPADRVPRVARGAAAVDRMDSLAADLCRTLVAPMDTNRD